MASVASAQPSGTVDVARIAPSAGVSRTGTEGATVSVVKLREVLKTETIPALSRERTRQKCVPSGSAPVVAVEGTTVAIHWTVPNPASAATWTS